MKQLLVFLFLLCSISVYAQDVIVKKDGSTILSKVLEVNTADVKYKKFSNLDGPTYTINKSELLSINYENGERDDFSEVSSVSESENKGAPCYIESVVDSRNAEIISSYNRFLKPSSKVKVKDKPAFSRAAILGVRQNSVMSNNDIEMKIIRRMEYIVKNGVTGTWRNVQRYYINITNKSERIIYIDKGNCFRIYNDGKAECYFDPTRQTVTSQGGGKSVSVGLGSVANVLGIGGKIGTLAGGINVGGSSTHSVSNVYFQQRIIAIPPHGKVNLTEQLFPDGDDRDNPIEDVEYFTFKRDEILSLGSGNFYVKRGETKVFEENDIQWTRDYYITYSTDDTFRTYSSLHAALYIREILGFDNECGGEESTRYVKKRAELFEGADEYTIITEIPLDQHRMIPEYMYWYHYKSKPDTNN